MITRFNTKRLTSLDQIVDVAPTLDRASKHEVYYPDGTASKFMIIKNDSIETVIDEKTGKVKVSNEVCAVSKKYSILQHADAINHIVSGIQAANITGAGCFRDYGNVFSAELYMDNFSIKDPAKDDQINVGLRFVNSFNTSVGFVGELFGWRQTCSNGMAMAKMIPNAPRMSFKHLGDVSKRIADSIKDLVQRTATMEGAILEVINEATGRIVRFESYEQQKQFFVRYVGSEKQAETLIALEGFELEMDQWTLYNGLTHLASHGDLSFDQYNRFHANAEKFLLQKEFDLPVMTTMQATI